MLRDAAGIDMIPLQLSLSERCVGLKSAWGHPSFLRDVAAADDIRRRTRRRADVVGREPGCFTVCRMLAGWCRFRVERAKARTKV